MPRGTTRPAGGTAGTPATPGSAAGAWVIGAVDTVEGADEPAGDGVDALEQPATSTIDASANAGIFGELISQLCPPRRLANQRTCAVRTR
ncbi:hypothetical protein MMAD_39980 [Mycolicibacterium madagascariense]|uniref:Uncharacterized protein n=1 Tax=Mycolicibacterium madagascariense TaxID=212765 RepID=A0A7I7XKU1_9MYCO|nr:hypothetical protein MMAD_39980 [Mycolicibacterium madagascariense]